MSTAPQSQSLLFLFICQPSLIDRINHLKADRTPPGRPLNLSCDLTSISLIPISHPLIMSDPYANQHYNQYGGQPGYGHPQGQPGGYPPQGQYGQPPQQQGYYPPMVRT